MRLYLTPRIAKRLILGVVVLIGCKIIVSSMQRSIREPVENSKVLLLTTRSTALGHVVRERDISRPCVTPNGKPKPALTECLLEAINLRNETIPKDLRAFNPDISLIGTHKTVLELIEVFHQEMTSHNLTYFLDGGTLLGSWRHHGFIPWDDDGDVFVDVKDVPKLRDVLTQLPGRYQFSEGGKWNKLKWKLYLAKTNQPRNPYIPWNFPFLDICFYNRGRTHISDIDYRMQQCRFEVSSVFPVVLRPFYHLSLPAPRDTAKYIRQEYNGTESVCKSPPWTHNQGKELQSVEVPCSDLYPYFPFVKHTTSSLGHLESLMIGGQVVYSVETNTVGELH